jgi:hypothetical protein
MPRAGWFIPLACIVVHATASMGSLSSASAAELSDPTFESLVYSVPAVIRDQIENEITVATSFSQAASDDTTHWAPRSIVLIEIVKAPSPTLPDTYLYAFRYVVSVLNRGNELAVDGTFCSVTLVLHHGVFDAPTVGCDRVDLSRAAAAL